MAKNKGKDTVDRKAEAKDLYMLGKLDQKRICAILTIAENTFTRWKKEGQWDEIANARKTGKDKLADILLEQILEQDRSMKAEGRKLMTSKEINSMWQMHNMLRKVEETGTAAAIVTTLTAFTDWLRMRHPDLLKSITIICDEYIMEQLNKE